MCLSSTLDLRTRGWLFVDSPKSTIIITLTYLFIVWIGPKIMRKWVERKRRRKKTRELFTIFQIMSPTWSRKPFQLKKALIVYNMGLALLNLYIAVELFIGSSRKGYSYVCEPCRYKDFSKEELRVCKRIFVTFQFREIAFFISSLLLNRGNVDNERSLVVLFLQMHRILWQFFLHSTQEGQSTIILACVRI